jgi:hypothetical protein
MRQLCGLILFAGWLTLAHASDSTVESLREQGLLEYDRGHYAVAVIHFQTAAEAGDARSAEILSLMFRLGAQLYGDQVTADTAKSAHFAAIASERRLVAATNPASAGR